MGIAMKTKNVNQIWAKGQHLLEQQIPADMDLVKRKGHKQVRSSNFLISVNLILFTAISLTAGVVGVMNVFGYYGNTLLFSIHTGLLLYGFFLVYFNLTLAIRLRKINNPTHSLMETIQQQIRFYTHDYECWLILNSLLISNLTFGLNSIVDNMDGTYPIYHPYRFVLIMVGQLLFIYLVMKISSYPHIKRLKGYLSDLEENTQLNTKRIQLFNKKNRWWIVSLLILLMAFLIIMIIIGIQKAG